MREVAVPKWVWLTAASLLVLSGVFLIFRLGNQASAGVNLNDPVVWLEDGARGRILQVNGSTGEITAEVDVGDAGDSISVIPQGRDTVYLNRNSGEVGVIGAVSLAVDNVEVLEAASGPLSGPQLEFLGDLDASTSAYVIDSTRILVVEPGAGIRLPIPTPEGVGDTTVDSEGRLLAITADGTRVGITSKEGLVEYSTLVDPVAESTEAPKLVTAGEQVYVVDIDRRTVTAVLEGGLGPTNCVAGSLSDVLVAGSVLSTTRGVDRILVHDPEQGVLSITEPSRSACFDIEIPTVGDNFGTPVAVDDVAYLPNYETGRIEVVDLIERTVVGSLGFSNRRGEAFELEVIDNAVWANEPQGLFAAIVRGRQLQRIAKFGRFADTGGNGDPEGESVPIVGEGESDDRIEGLRGDPIGGADDPDGLASGGDNTAVDEAGSGGSQDDTPGLDFSDLAPPSLVTGVQRPANINELLANFEFSADTVNVGEEVTFTDISTGTPVSWNWSFGDGTGAEGPEVSNTWDEEGVFTVTLFIVDAQGEEASQEIQITVVAVDVITPPTADFGFRSGTIEVGETIIFESQTTGDPDLLVWDLGDDTTASGEVVEHSYTAAGTYIVELTASNSAGSDTTSTAITVIDAVVAPEAVIGSFTRIVETGDSVLLVSNSSNSPTAVSWEFGDGETGLGTEVRHSWETPGIFRIRLFVSNSAGESTAFADIQVQPRVDLPIARFDQSSLEVVVGESINFNDLSLNNPTTFSWEFGDGSAASGPNVSKSWDEADVYTVTLTVGNEAGQDEVSKSVTVIEPPPDPPIAGFSVADATVPVNTIVNFIDTSTNEPTAWSWDFGDGNGSQSKSPTHAYSAPGDFLVTLTVSSAGGSDSTSQTIVVVNPPVASFTQNITELDVTFTDTSTNNPTSWLWDMGDGTILTGQNPVHTFTPGGHVVSLIASNAAGSSAPVTTSITVAALPNANFGFAVTGLEVNFSDTSTNVPTSWFWGFGDGTSVTTQSPSHTFAAPGTYDVTLTVTNAAGQGTPPRTRSVVVDHAPPVANFTCIVFGGGVTCDGAISSNEVSYSWVAPDAVQPISGQGTATPTFTFLASGTYPITLTVANLSGATDMITNSVSVTVPQPPVITALTAVPNGNGDVELSATATNSPTGWEWTALNGSPTPSTGTTSAGATSTFTTTYPADGTWEVRVTATNGVGSSTDSIMVTVNVLTPPVVTGVTDPLNSGGTVEFLGTATNGPFTMWEWTMPTGMLVSGGTTATPTFEFTSAGPQPGGTVRARNVDGWSALFPVTVNVVGPTASFTLSDDGTGLVSFSNNSTSGAGVSYEWDFDDGTMSTLQNPPPLNYASGTYNITLTVTFGLLSDATSQPLVVP